MKTSLYFAILPIVFGVITLVLSLICLMGYLTSNETATRRKLLPWFKRFLIVAFILLSTGLFFTAKHF